MNLKDFYPLNAQMLGVLNTHDPAPLYIQLADQESNVRANPTDDNSKVIPILSKELQLRIKHLKKLLIVRNIQNLF
jgi:hypothetical protein